MGKKNRFSITKMKGENKISQENAIKTVLAACLKFDIDIDADYGISEVHGQKKEAMLDSIEDYIMRGIISIDEGTWEITHKLQGNYSEALKELVYRPISGEIKSAMDGFGDKERHAAQLAIIASSCKQSSAVIGKLIAIDMKVSEVVLDFFT